MLDEMVGRLYDRGCATNRVYSGRIGGVVHSREKIGERLIVSVPPGCFRASCG